MPQESPITLDFYKSMRPTDWVDRKNYQWRSLVRMSVRDEERFRKKLTRHIADKFFAVAQIVYSKGVPAGIDFAMRDMFDNSVMTDLIEHYNKISLRYARVTYRSVVSEARNKLNRDLLQLKAFGPDWERALKEYLQLHGVRFVSDINETTRKKIIKILTDGINKNLTLNEIVRQLVSPKMHQQRALVIARTETTRAMNAGILIAAASVPYEVRKQWITSEDEKVRGNPFSHVALHGTSLPLDMAFNNGEHIRFPGDPNASAENVINCRCVLSINPVTDQFGRAIPKRVNANDSDILNMILNLI